MGTRMQVGSLKPHLGTQPSDSELPGGVDPRMDAMYRGWAARLTEQHRGALAAYRTPGVYYILNYFLRHGEVPEQKPWQHFTPNSIRNLAYQLTTALGMAPPLRQPMTVYRSMVLPDRFRPLEGQVKGEWMEERGFLSTTSDMQVLRDFEQKRLTKPDQDHVPVCMRIHVPAGTRAAYIESALQRMEGAGFTEHEVLFPLGTPNGHSLQFTSDVRMVDGLPTVDVRLVPNAARANWYPPFPPGFKPTGFNLAESFDSDDPPAAKPPKAKPGATQTRKPKPTAPGAKPAPRPAPAPAAGTQKPAPTPAPAPAAGTQKPAPRPAPAPAAGTQKPAPRPAPAPAAGTQKPAPTPAPAPAAGTQKPAPTPAPAAGTHKPAPTPAPAPAAGTQKPAPRPAPAPAAGTQKPAPTPAPAPRTPPATVSPTPPRPEGQGLHGLAKGLEMLRVGFAAAKHSKLLQGLLHGRPQEHTAPSAEHASPARAAGKILAAVAEVAVGSLTQDAQLRADGSAKLKQQVSQLDLGDTLKELGQAARHDLSMMRDAWRAHESAATPIAPALQQLNLPADYSGTLSLRELCSQPAKVGAAERILDGYYGKLADPTTNEKPRGFLSSFPDWDEVESRDTMQAYLRDRKQSWDISVQVKDGKIVGGSNYRILKTPQGSFGVIEHLWTDQPLRHQGLGRATASEAIARMKAQNPALKGVFIEVNDPWLMRDEQLRREPVDPAWRLDFWNGLGFRAIDHRYAQPALSASQRPVEHLMLAYQPLDGTGAEAVDSSEMRAFCESYFGTWLDEPEKDPTYRALFEQKRAEGRRLALVDMRRRRPSLA